ncbi:siderophore-interacting protein [Nocardia callitridis]|uniref:Siderophore-interacting protein n=1 Tax=Nocardia callitridis TaxID=648753 RepID=A0ABP9KSP7_9NOCA
MPGIRQKIRALSTANRPFSITVRVESVRQLTPGFRRVTVSSDEFGEYADPAPADAFKLLIPPDGHGRVDFPQRGEDGLPFWPEGAVQPVLRAFTVRAYDAAARRLEFDVAEHATGVAMDWVAATAPGSLIGLAGMRREFAVGDGAEAFLFVADASALPAVAAITESLDTTAPVEAYLTVTHEQDRALLPARDNLTVHWVTDLTTALDQHPTPPRRTQVWLGAEASVVRTLRRRILDDWHIDRDDLHAAAYWKAGQDSTQLDSINLVRYQKAAEEGHNMVDPDLRERIELTL